MRMRIHGHYRIDARGRVIRLADVNDPGLTYATPLPKLVFENPPMLSFKRMNAVELCVVASVIAILIALLMTVVPKVRKAAIAAQAAAARTTIAHHQSSTNAPATSPAAR